MTRNRTPIADAINALTAAIRHTTTPAIAPDQHTTAEKPLALAAHELDLEHLGCWISIPPVPRLDLDVDYVAATRETTAGRLVGLRHGNPPSSTALKGTRTLVIQQGTHIGPIEVEIVRTILVAPKGW